MSMVELGIFIPNLVTFAMAHSIMRIWIPHVYDGVTGTCIGAASLVLQAYAFLLAMNIRYTSIFVIPAIFLVFIVAFWSKFRTTEAYFLRHDSRGYNALRLDTMTSLVNIRSLLYILQPPLVTLPTWLKDGSFVMAHFLVFFSAALLALAEMIANLPIGARASPGVAHVLPVMHKTCIVVVVITFHATAAKWLGGYIVLACLPEFVAVLVWFTVHYDHGDYTIRGFSINSLSSVLVITLAVLQGSMNSNTTEIPPSMLHRAFWIFAFSSAISKLSAWMLQQWPGNLSNPRKLLIRQLEYSGDYSISVSSLSILMRYVLDNFGGAPRLILT